MYTYIHNCIHEMFAFVMCVFYIACAVYEGIFDTHAMEQFTIIYTFRVCIAPPPPSYT